MKKKILVFCLAMLIFSSPLIQIVEGDPISEGDSGGEKKKTPYLDAFLDCKDFNELVDKLSKPEICHQLFAVEEADPDVIAKHLLRTNPEFQDFVRLILEKELEANVNEGWRDLGPSIFMWISSGASEIFSGHPDPMSDWGKLATKGAWNKIRTGGISQSKGELTGFADQIATKVADKVAKELAEKGVGELAGGIPVAGAAKDLVFFYIEHDQAAKKATNEKNRMLRFANFFMGRGGDLIVGIKEYEEVYNYYWQSDEEFEESIEGMDKWQRDFRTDRRGDIRKDVKDKPYEKGAEAIAEKFWKVSPIETPLLGEDHGWFGLDWDPEFEETWYWEGYDYPATDVNYERYPYVDEWGAYDWDYDQSEIEEAWEWAPYI
jgi:hypothetical protein